MTNSKFKIICRGQKEKEVEGYIFSLDIKNKRFYFGVHKIKNEYSITELNSGYCLAKSKSTNINTLTDIIVDIFYQYENVAKVIKKANKNLNANCIKILNNQDDFQVVILPRWMEDLIKV